jgi:hypothetical protein
MGMNLHGIVRAAINTVNPDILGTWRESTGSTTDAAGRQVPNYTDHPDTLMQVQALSGRDLRHTDFLSLQGIKRAVYLFPTVQGISSPQAKGGDLLQFPMVTGGPILRWLVVVELEQWSPNGTWCKVGVVLQDDVATVGAPDVVGLTLAAATTAITAVGLTLGDVTSANSPSVPVGDAISQSPAAGVQVPYDTEIDVVISLGPLAL